MEDSVRLWVLNLGAVGFSLYNINMILSTLVLLASFIYTVIKISEKLKK